MFAGDDGLLSLSGDCQAGYWAGTGETEKAARVQPPNNLIGPPSATPHPPEHGPPVCLCWCTSGTDEFGGKGYPHISTTSKLPAPIRTLQWENTGWRLTDSLDSPPALKEWSTYLHLESTCRSWLKAPHTFLSLARQKPFSILLNSQTFMSCSVVFFVAVYKVVTFTGATPQDSQSFPTEGFSKTNFHSCAFFYTFVQDMEVLFVLFSGSVYERCAAATHYNQDLEHSIRWLHSFCYGQCLHQECTDQSFQDLLSARSVFAQLTIPALSWFQKQDRIFLMYMFMSWGVLETKACLCFKNSRGVFLIPVINTFLMVKWVTLFFHLNGK